MKSRGRLARFILLPELELKRTVKIGKAAGLFYCDKQSKAEVCPKCASLATSIYDHRTVKIKDAPLRGNLQWLVIKKRRFWCKTCQKPFTEPVRGIWPRGKTTQRYRRSVLWACENFSDLKRVRKAYRCSNNFLYKILNEQLELKVRMNQYPWPKTIGIDEHSFHKRKTGKLPFVSMVVDYNNKKLFEVVPGKTGAELQYALAHISGRKNVQNVILDLSDPYKGFATDFFPNAKLIADKFHVLRLLHPHINRTRKEITGDRRSLRIRKLLLMNSKNLDYWTRQKIWQWLELYPQLKELYMWKEALHRFYRINGYNRARKALLRMLDEMAGSNLKEIKTLRRTLQKWHREILNYFSTKLTNARTEGYNNKAKVLKRKAYGYRSFTNYRLRLLCACY